MLSVSTSVPGRDADQIKEGHKSGCFGNHNALSLNAHLLNTYWGPKACKGEAPPALQVLILNVYIKGPHGKEVLMIAFCPSWTISVTFVSNLSVSCFCDPKVGISWWRLTCWLMSDVFSVPVPVLAGRSGVWLCVRMKMDTPQMTVWRESSPMSTELVNLALVLTGRMAPGERWEEAVHLYILWKQWLCWPSCVIVHSLFERRRTSSS